MINTSQVGHVVFYGQSLSVGINSTPTSTSQPYSNLMFSLNVQDSSLPLIPLVETDDETPVSGCANHLSELYSGFPQFLGSTAGVSGKSIEELSKGGLYYTNNLAPQIAAGAASADYPAAICWVQGEVNTVSNPYAGYYLGLMETLADDMRSDLAASYGSSADIPFITYQTSSRALLNDNIVLDQLAFARSDSNAAISTPIYPLEFSDTLHLTAKGYETLGNYFAKAIQRLDQGQQAFVEPVSASLTGSVVTIALNVPVAPLVIDTSNWQTQDSGLYIQDASGQVGIQSVSVSGSNINVTLNRAIVGTAKVRYGLDYTDASLGQPNMGMGNIRDSDTSTSPTNGEVLHNWLPHFQLTIIDTDTDMAERIVHDYEMADFFDVVPGAQTSNGKNQYRSQLSVSNYTSGSADTASTLASKTGNAVNIGSTEFLATNRAVESGVIGVRNSNGTLGYATTLAGGFNTNADSEIDLTENGGLVYVADSLEDGTTIKLPNGSYNGHIVHIMNTGNSRVLLESPSVSIWGNDLRLADNSYTFSAGEAVISIRQREVVSLVWASQKWRVLSWERTMYSGNAWYETTRGIEMRGLANIQAVNQATQIALPTALNGDITAFNTEVVITDYAGGTWADGDTVFLLDQANIQNTYAWGVSAVDPHSNIAIMATPTEDGSGIPLNVSWMLRTSLGLL